LRDNPVRLFNLSYRALGSGCATGNASVELHSVTPCRSLLGPATPKPGERSEHGSLLSGNLCPSRVKSQWQSLGRSDQQEDTGSMRLRRNGDPYGRALAEISYI
jgi:hypothetical protein